MQTDYGLRILMELAASQAGMMSVAEISTRHNISRNHLAKVAQNLTAGAFIQTTRGKGGGLSLAKPSNAITVGNVVRHLEADFGVVECLTKNCQSQCIFDSSCRLKELLKNATATFLSELDGVTIADLVVKKTSPDFGFSS